MGGRGRLSAPSSTYENSILKAAHTSKSPKTNITISIIWYIQYPQPSFSPPHPRSFYPNMAEAAPTVVARELLVLDVPPDDPANRSIANFWFLNVSKHCVQSANNGTSYLDQKASTSNSLHNTSTSPSTSAIPQLNPPTPECVNEGLRNNVLLGFLWGTLFIGLLCMLALVVLKHLRKARTIRETRRNWLAAQQRDMAESGLGRRGCVATPVVVMGGQVDPRSVGWASGV